MNTSHVPMIGTHKSICSCRQWFAPERREDETQGEYTHRAFEAYQAHVLRNTQLSLLADHQTLFDGGAR